jgi:hypothetical protein
MSTWNIPGCKELQATRKQPTSRCPIGLHGLLQGLLYFTDYDNLGVFGFSLSRRNSAGSCVNFPCDSFFLKCYNNSIVQQFYLNYRNTS